MECSAAHNSWLPKVIGSQATLPEKGLTEVETRFGLQRNDEPGFFSEWQGELPAITAAEEAWLSRAFSIYTVPSELQRVLKQLGQLAIA